MYSDLMYSNVLYLDILFPDILYPDIMWVYHKNKYIKHVQKKKTQN
jgi:hypothetical protein